MSNPTANPAAWQKASIGASGFGTLLSAMGTFSNASAEKKALKTNAAYTEYQAADAARRGELEGVKVGQRAAQVRGAQRASMGARGVDVEDGSPLDILRETDYFSELDQRTVKENTAREIYGFRAAGANMRTQASGINPWLSAGGSALAGAGLVADRWYQYQNSKPKKT